MARRPNPERFQVGALVATPGDNARWVAVSQDRALPDRFAIHARLALPTLTVTLDVVLDAAGEPCVQSMSLSAAVVNPAAITTTSVRSVLVHQLLGMAVEQISQPVDALPGLRDANTEAVSRWSPAVRRLTPLERIRQAGDLYREAVANGSRRPVSDVGSRLGYSQSQASRYIKAARLDGQLEGVPEPTFGLRR